jgi:TonB family protein
MRVNVVAAVILQLATSIVAARASGPSRAEHSAATFRRKPPASSPDRPLPGVDADSLAARIDYPVLPLLHGQQRCLHATIQVDTAGHGRVSELPEADELFTAAILKGVERTRFLPAMRSGRPVEGTLRVMMFFWAGFEGENRAGWVEVITPGRLKSLGLAGDGRQELDSATVATALAAHQGGDQHRMRVTNLRVAVRVALSKNDDRTQRLPVPSSRRVEEEVDPDLVHATWDQAALARLAHYPEGVSDSMAERRVIVEVQVNEAGEAVDAKVKEGAGEPFDRLATSIVMRIPFEAATVKGHPVADRVKVPVVFRKTD